MSDEQHPKPSVWWRWRRWISLASILAVALETFWLVQYVPAERLSAMGAVIAWSYSTWGMLALQYPLGSTVEDVVSRYLSRGST